MNDWYGLWFHINAAFAFEAAALAKLGGRL